MCDDVPIGRIVFDDQEALARQLRLGRLPGRRHDSSSSPSRYREVKRGALAGVAFDPDLPPEQFGQALANGQAQPGAAVMASGGGVNLLERLKQTALPIQRDADAGVPKREMQQPLVGVAEKIGVRLMPGGDAARSVPGRDR